MESLSVPKFTHDILHSQLITHPPPKISDLVDAYNTTLPTLFEVHAPIKTKTFQAEPVNKWLKFALSTLKSARRHIERLWLRRRSPHQLKFLRTATNKYHSAIIYAKKLLNPSLASSCSANPRKIWNSILLDRKPSSQLPSLASSESLSQMFATFFSDKIQKLLTALKSSSTLSSPHTLPRHNPTNLSVFSYVTGGEVSKIISQSSNTFCDLDHIPIFILKQCLSAFSPTLTTMINITFGTGVFPDEFKAGSVIPLLKKYNLDREDLFNYRSISQLSFLCKLTKRVVRSRLTDLLSNINFLNLFYSAYTKHHSTESTLLALHDHIIKAMSQQQVTAVCLLDLSAAFRYHRPVYYPASLIYTV